MGEILNQGNLFFNHATRVRVFDRKAFASSLPIISALFSVVLISSLRTPTILTASLIDAGKIHSSVRVMTSFLDAIV